MNKQPSKKEVDAAIETLMACGGDFQASIPFILFAEPAESVMTNMVFNCPRSMRLRAVVGLYDSLPHEHRMIVINHLTENAKAANKPGNVRKFKRPLTIKDAD